MRFFVQIVTLSVTVALVLGSCNLFSDDNCKYEDYTQKMNLDTVGVWKDVEVVEVMSFKSFVFGNPRAERAIQSGKLMVEPIERGELTKRQINTLKHILFSYTPQKGCKGYGMGRDCIFNPHHAIIFYNSVKEPIAHIEICFTCNEYKVYSELGNFSSCGAFYERINSLLKSAGIEKFMEIGREYED